MKSHLFILLLSGFSVTVFAEAQAGTDPVTYADSTRSDDVHLFERCTLAVKHADGKIARRQPFKMISQDAHATIYEVEVENVKSRIIHNSGQLAEYKTSQTLIYERDIQSYKDSKVRYDKNKGDELDQRRQRIPKWIQDRESDIEGIEALMKKHPELAAMAKQRDSLRKDIRDLRDELLLNRAPEYPTPPPKDGVEQSYYSMETIIKDLEDSGQPPSIHGGPLRAIESIGTKEFLAEKISSEVELYKYLTRDHAGRLSWSMGGQDEDGKHVEPETSYVITCDAQT